MPDEIQMSRQEFYRRFGILSHPDAECVNFYSPEGVLTSRIVFVDEEVAKAEIEWLERLYAL